MDRFSACGEVDFARDLTVEIMITSARRKCLRQFTGALQLEKRGVCHGDPLPRPVLFGSSTEAVDDACRQEQIILALQLIVRVREGRMQILALSSDRDRIKDVVFHSSSE